MSAPENNEAAGALAFTVDTHLLRELGALLVGRDSTALVELLKNAYDADATSVEVSGESLTRLGSISVSDDGHGMTYDDFVSKFLRIAGRSKEDGARRSPAFGRVYTGAKGIGRLAARKLGTILEVDSVPARIKGEPQSPGVIAHLNWAAIEASTSTIDQVRAVHTESREVGPDAGQGTTVRIRGLESDWSGRQLNNFLSEVRSTRPDPSLHAALPPGVVADDVDVPAIRISDSKNKKDPGFAVTFSGEFGDSEAQWPTLLAHVNWVVVVDALKEDEVEYRIIPTSRTMAVIPAAEVRKFVHKRTTRGPRFAARIFVRDGSDQRDQRLPDALEKFSKASAGVRLFLEGFRVLPYGTSRNDWLGLDQSSVRREGLGLAQELVAPVAEVDDRVYQLSNNSYFGGVFLLQRDSAGLQMVINREGFLPGPELDDLVDTVRRGIDLSVRIRAMHGAVAREEVKRKKAASREQRLRELQGSSLGGAKTAPTASEQRRAWLDLAQEAAKSLRSTSGSIVGTQAKQDLEVVTAVIDELRASDLDSLDEATQLRVLASFGTQLGAFVHEVRGILGQGRVVLEQLRRLRNDVPSDFRQRLSAIVKAQEDVVDALERQAVYLVDSIGAETRRRRSEQPVSQRWLTAERVLAASTAARNVVVKNLVSPEIRTPPMFAAEVNVIFVNLLSNAIKAAALAPPDERVVRVGASRRDGWLDILVENSGLMVDVADSERLFRAFETTTSEIDEELGQGLGLGLTLTRRIVDDYGGYVRFVEPQPPMSTAIQISLPERR